MTKAWAVTMCIISRFARMADFFGRDMQAHRHDQFFQMHFLDTGQIELQLDDHRYSGAGAAICAYAALGAACFYYRIG